MPPRRPSPRRSRRVRALAAAAALALAAAPLRAQADTALARALDLEGAGKYAESVPLFRRALAHDLAGALLGLERAYASLGRTDSLLPTLDSLVRARPDEPLVRTIQLRALHMAGADARARLAFDAWAAAAPRDPQPYRDYARLLLESGRTSAADTVLQRAVQATGSGRDFAYETAQLRAALGMWEPSARSWREALATADYLHQAATFALQAAAAADRPAVRAVLLAPPVEVAARRTVAGLDLAWGAPADAWAALAALPPSDSVLDVWIAFADEAEARGATAAASQALAAAHRARPHAQCFRL
jgi:tetratricopeptide (TPR) repeat protein